MGRTQGRHMRSSLPPGLELASKPFSPSQIHPSLCLSISLPAASYHSDTMLFCRCWMVIHCALPLRWLCSMWLEQFIGSESWRTKDGGLIRARGVGVFMPPDIYPDHIVGDSRQQLQFIASSTETIYLFLQLPNNSLRGVNPRGHVSF